MADLVHILSIKATPQEVFEQISSPDGLNTWWTKACVGRPELGSLYELDFGSVVWQAQVTDVLVGQEMEYTICKSDSDWLDTQIRFEIKPQNDSTQLKFIHSGWGSANDHYHTSNHCWGLYLRILRRYLEFGDEVAYEQRLII